MKIDYTTEEINDILLSKNLNDYYFAILSRKPLNFTKKDYTERIQHNPFIPKDVKEALEEISSIDLGGKSLLKEKLEELKYKLLGLCVKENRWGIITVINGRIYDTVTSEFIDPEKFLIGRYENITNFCSEDNARPKLFHPGDEDLELTCDTVLLDFDDLSTLEKYGETYIKTEYFEDLAPRFIEEYNTSKKYTTKKI